MPSLKSNSETRAGEEIDENLKYSQKCSMKSVYNKKKSTRQ